jgi:hypothetical protein
MPDNDQGPQKNTNGTCGSQQQNAEHPQSGRQEYPMSTSVMFQLGE